MSERGDALLHHDALIVLAVVCIVGALFCLLMAKRNS